MKVGSCVHGNNFVTCPECSQPASPPEWQVLMKGYASPLPITGYPHLDEYLQDVFRTMKQKGHDYRQGNDADLLHNFRTVAETVGTDMEKVWFTYFYKHYAAMVTFIKEGGQKESEPIKDRVKDMIVYLVLFHDIIDEMNTRGQLPAVEVQHMDGIEPEPEISEPAKMTREEFDRLFGPLTAPPTPRKLVVGGTPGQKANIEVAGAELELDIKRQRKLAGLDDDGIFLEPGLVDRIKDTVDRLKTANAFDVPNNEVIPATPPERAEEELAIQKELVEAAKNIGEDERFSDVIKKLDEKLPPVIRPGGTY